MCVVVRTGASVWPSVDDHCCLPGQDFALCKYNNYCYHYFDQHEQKKKKKKKKGRKRPPKHVDSSKHVDTVKVWIRTLLPLLLYPSISISVYLDIYISKGSTNLFTFYEEASGCSVILMHLD